MSKDSQTLASCQSWKIADYLIWCQPFVNAKCYNIKRIRSNNRWVHVAIVDQVSHNLNIKQKAVRQNSIKWGVCHTEATRGVFKFNDNERSHLEWAANYPPLYCVGFLFFFFLSRLLITFLWRLHAIPCFRSYHYFWASQHSEKVGPLGCSLKSQSWFWRSNLWADLFYILKTKLRLLPRELSPNFWLDLGRRTSRMTQKAIKTNNKNPAGVSQTKKKITGSYTEVNTKFYRGCNHFLQDGNAFKEYT